MRAFLVLNKTARKGFMNIYSWCIAFFCFIFLEPWPICSSGHALLLAPLTTFFKSSTLILSMMDHVAHMPIALTLLLFFLPAWFDFFKDSWQQGSLLIIIGAGIVIDLITVICYLCFAIVDKEIFPLWLGFFITASLLISLHFCPAGNSTFIPSISSVLLLGLAQGVALLPGISRLGGYICNSSLVGSFS